MQNQLYFGDNLQIMRDFKDESVDLIYLDPPFNSQRAYNVFFPDKSGHMSAAQIQAFEDTWSWGPEADSAYQDIMSGLDYSPQLKEMMSAFYKYMGTSDLMAYLTMMAVRIVEMHRVLKPTGSIYLHCDPTASHYLKCLLDQIFGVKNFRNEIIWRRSQPKGHATTRYPSAHDVIFYYAKSPRSHFKPQHLPHDEAYLEKFYRYVEEGTGRRYMLDTLANPNKNRPNLTYEFPPKSGTVRVWRWTRDRMLEEWKKGRVIIPKEGGVARYKRYLDEMAGSNVTDLWTDIEHLHGSNEETIGYPTQKPLALLERIISASTSEGDIVLDPFCGCGTAVIAAEKLGRHWIGIDITYLAIYLIKQRLAGSFPDAKFVEWGQPKSYEDAIVLAEKSKSQFESWAVSLVEGQPYKSKGGGDTGIDGLLYFRDFEGGHHRVIIEVKGGGYQPKDVRALAQVMKREKSPLGVLIALKKPTPGMRREAAAMGKWTPPGGRKAYPVLQIFTIEEHFTGRRPDLPDTSETLKRAQRDHRESEKQENQPKLRLD